MVVGVTPEEWATVEECVESAAGGVMEGLPANDWNGWSVL